MSDVVIEVSGLGKKYRLGVAQHDTLRESLSELFRFRRKTRAGDASEFWALKDVSFEVKRGEVLGVIGRNGAGKSTLLKILSRITEPTNGRIAIRGRVASLLEVGTGFHPELTGRENIFLNGAILGMSRAEIRRKFDEIVAFAEVDRFIDTPVKRYSSGMYVRLAFAVAAHLEPEILIVDEVLAVGDAAFQQKCLGKMQEVSRKGGRTVLFVSHNTGAVVSLCDRGLLLRNGQLAQVGPAAHVVREYLGDASAGKDGEYDVHEHAVRKAGAAKIIRKIRLSTSDGTSTSSLFPDQPFQVSLECSMPAALPFPRLAIAIEDEQGRRLMTMASYFEKDSLPSIEGNVTARCACESLQLAPGRYLLSASIGSSNEGLLDSLDGVAWFDVLWRNNHPSGEPHHTVYGPMLRRSTWRIEPQK
jgi:lipopolysaccharide transport system ATP-binding protein